MPCKSNLAFERIVLLLRFHGRLVRKTLSYSKNASYLQRHLDLEDPVFNFVRAHQALRVTLP
jgi:hypothetical protein